MGLEGPRQGGVHSDHRLLTDGWRGREWTWGCSQTILERQPGIDTEEQLGARAAHPRASPVDMLLLIPLPRVPLVIVRDGWPFLRTGLLAEVNDQKQLPRVWKALLDIRALWLFSSGGPQLIHERASDMDIWPANTRCWELQR